nr:ATP-binding protein [Pseudoteredinibacter isoporae]
MEEQGKRNDLSIRASVNEFSDTGLIARYYNQTMDVLEDTNQELEFNKLKYEAISQNSPIGIISVDPSGCCLFANIAINETMGLDAELLTGLNASNYSGEDPSLLVLKEWIRLLLGNKEATGEYEFKNRHGDIKSVYLQVGLELTPDEQIKGYILTINDITERLQLERQLKQAQKMESVGHMAAGLAHEINSPLQFISSNVDFIKSSFSNLIAMQKVYTDLLCKIDSHANLPESNDDLDFIMEEVPNAIDQTLEGVDRVSNIIRFMKELEQPSGREFASQNLNRTIENSVVVTRNEWKASADLKLELDKSLPETPCIESEISQVLMILIVNACQAIQESSPNSKGTIKISSRFDEDNVTICVMDNGPGIPNTIIDKIFDPFFTTKPVGMGTGQGLSVAYKIINNQHGGKIAVKSKERVGTQFRITLPRKRENSESVNFNHGESVTAS